MRFVLDNSLLLLAQTVTAVIWANLDLSSYGHFAHYLHFAANDIGMVFFFALAAKEVFEATLPGGPLASPRQALSPLAAAVGGMATPALIYVALVSMNGPGGLMRGWAIPCATDIAFSAMIARLIFPSAHPAIPFLLLVAIADDALGLVIAVFLIPDDLLTAAAVDDAAGIRRQRFLAQAAWTQVSSAMIDLGLLADPRCSASSSSSITLMLRLSADATADSTCSVRRRHAQAFGTVNSAHAGTATGQRLLPALPTRRLAPRRAPAFPAPPR